MELAAASAPQTTVFQAIGWAARQLGPHPAPRLEAEQLLAHLMGLSRARLLAALRQPLDADTEQAFASLVERRARGEPLAYLLGQVEFYGLDLEVTPATFVPRPETELLVDWAIHRLRRRDHLACVIDVGTGCGAIALALAKAVREAQVVATDISVRALEVAMRNAERHGLQGRVRLVEADLLPVAPARFDLVVANLPYVAENDPDLESAVANYEPATALYGGRDGLGVVRRLLAVLPGRLAPGADIGLEIGWRQGAAALELARRWLPGGKAECRPDLAGHDRLLIVEDVPCRA